jgi:endonuclease/exonuclease/phosphatase family metal-dependent hydrolase
LLDDYESRREPMAAGIAAVDPDLLALQEICWTDAGKDSLVDLVTALGERTGRTYASLKFETHFNPLSSSHEGIAIVTPHPISFSENVPLPAGFFPRGGILARVDTGKGVVLFAATHLDFLLPANRQEELATLRAAIEAQRLPDESVLLAGDMNENPDGPCIVDTVAAGYTDLWDLAHPGDPGPTSPVPNPMNRIDYVMSSDPSSAFTPLDTSIFLNAQVNGVWPSDHFAVYAELVPN